MGILVIQPLTNPFSQILGNSPIPHTSINYYFRRESPPEYKMLNLRCSDFLKKDQNLIFKWQTFPRSLHYPIDNQAHPSDQQNLPLDTILTSIGKEHISCWQSGIPLTNPPCEASKQKSKTTTALYRKPKLFTNADFPPYEPSSFK